MKRNFDGLHVLLSASLPKELEGTRRAQELFDLMVVLIGGVLSSSGVLVFGGHPAVTPLVHRIALSVGHSVKPQIKLFQLNKFRKQAPEEVNDERVFGKVRWVGGGGASLDEDLGSMRDEMVKSSHAGIFVGGKTEGYSGRVPGVRDEYQRFVKRHKSGPAYLLGMLGGESLKMIESMEREREREPNTLSEDELKITHHGDNVDLVSSIVLADLQRLIDRQPPSENVRKL